MKKLISILCAVMMTISASAFTVNNKCPDFSAKAPKAEQGIAPVNASIWSQSYCSAAFTWYYYGNSYFAICFIDGDTGEQVAAIFVTPDECDYFAYTDGVAFPESDDYESHYYASTWWILNAGTGLMKLDGWNSHIIEIGSDANSYLGLKPGKYQVGIWEYDGYGNLTAGPARVNFTLVDKKVSNLKAEVASDKKTATLTWETPELAKNERLYVSVLSGAEVAYDNYDGKTAATSPLTIDVQEGKTYSASIQILNKQNAAQGSQAKCDFTVGTNNYIPTDLNAEVYEGDNVRFTWKAVTEADRYEIVMYNNGISYANLTVSGTKKEITIADDGTYTWTLQAFTLGTDNAYYPACAPIEGNEFTTKAADIPEGAITLDIAGLEAAYAEYTKENGFEDNDPAIREGKYYWIIMLYCGDGDGMPNPWVVIYTDKERAISGVYSKARDNVDLSNCFINFDNNPSNFVYAEDVELRLYFQGYDAIGTTQGYYYGDYSGSFRMLGKDGKTYIGKFMPLLCNSYSYPYIAAANYNKDHIAMLDEDPDAYIDPFDAVEDILLERGFDLSKPMYNIMGQPVDATYKGVVIQDGKKALLQ